MRNTKEPLLDLTTLRVATYSVTVLWGSATRIGIEAVPYLIPLLLQIGFGFSPFHAGLVMLATASGNIGMKLATTAILRRFGFRTVAVVNGALAVIFVMACGFLMPSTPLAVMLCVLLGYGMARSMQFTTLATLAYADIDDAQKGSASTLWSAAQQMTIGMGIAYGAVCLRISNYLHGHGAGGPVFTLDDFRWAFLGAGVMVLLSVAGYARLPRDAGSAIAHGR
jgi:hypothetical protein